MKLIGSSTLNTLAKFVAKDNDRRALQAVAIIGNEVVATNGCILAKVTLPGEADTAPVLYIPTAKFKASEHPTITRSGDTVNLDTGYMVIKQDIFHDNYPDIDQIIPTTPPEFTIAFSTEYLMILCELFKGSKNRDNIVTNYMELDFHGPTSSVVARGNTKHGEAITALIMPLRMNK